MRNFFYILSFLIPLGAYSQADSIAHLYTFGGDNNDVAEEIEATSDGGYIAVGSTSSNSSGNTDVYLLKVDSLCNYEWSFALGGSNNDWGYSVKQTFDKGFIIAASSNSYGNGGYDAILMKRDSLGNFVWQKKYGGEDWDFAYSVVQTFDGGYVFCGETYNNSSGFSDVYVVKTNPLGDTLWTQTIGGALIDKGNCVIETSDSNIVVAGLKNTITDSTQAYVIKLNQNGLLLWDSAYGGPLYDDANAIVESANGNYITAGSSTNFFTLGDLDFYFLRMNSRGDLIWDRAFGNLGSQEAFDLLEDLSGDIISVGATKSAGEGMKDAQLFYITSGGYWGGLGPTYGSGNDDLFKSVTRRGKDKIGAAGSTDSFGSGLKDLFLLRLDTVALGAPFTLESIDDIIPLGVEKNQIPKWLMVYPNPAEGFVVFDLVKNKDENFVGLLIMDLLGNVVLEKKIFSGKNYIDLDDLTIDKGIYLYRLLKKSGEKQQGKFILK